MDRFLTKAATKDSKCGRHTSAQERHREFKSWTHVSGDLLFCTSCNIVLDHKRKSSVQIHEGTAKHKNSVKRTAEGSSGPAKRQKTLDSVVQLPSSTVSASEKNDICKEWVAMCAAANIPLSKTDNPAVRKFLKDRVVNGGAIPTSTTLQRIYMPREVQERTTQVKELLTGRPVAIICDEASDDIGRFVLNVLASPLEPDSDGKVESYLLETHFLASTNHSSVAQAVVGTVMSFGIQYNDVIIFNSDNAAYMKKAYNDVLRGLFPKSTHITCMSHILNLLGESFRKPFGQVDKFIRAFNALFWHAGARKGRFLRYLKKMEGSDNPKMAPNPVGTRWNCWYETVKYHNDKFHMYRRFLEEEELHSRGQGPDSLHILLKIMGDEAAVRGLKADMAFIVAKSALFVELTDFFQSQQALAIKVWHALEELEFHYTSSGVSMAEAGEFFPQSFTSQEKEVARQRFSEAYEATHIKLKKYMSVEGQPGLNYLKDIRIFNPKNIALMPHNVSEYHSIPDFCDLPQHELTRYVEKLGPSAVRASDTGIIDLPLFWKSVADHVPALAALASRYAFSTCSSADAERSFSLYNLILSSRRRRLTEDNIKGLVFLYYNKFSDVSFFE